MNKKTGVILGGIIASGVYAVYKIVDKNPDVYSWEWIRGLSDTDWEKQREKVQYQYLSSETSQQMKIKLCDIMERFDRVKESKTRKDLSDYIFPPKREHGWGLYKKE